MWVVDTLRTRTTIDTGTDDKRRQWRTGSTARVSQVEIWVRETALSPTLAIIHNNGGVMPFQSAPPDIQLIVLVMVVGIVVCFGIVIYHLRR